MSVFDSPFNQVFRNPFGTPFNGEATGVWSPALWFMSSEQGIWLDPSDLTAEKQAFRRNLLTYSEDLSHPAWGSHAIGVTVTNGAAIAPDGTLTANKITETATTDTHRRGYSLAGSVGRVRVFSFYAKAGERTLCRCWSWAGADTTTAVFDLVAGTCIGSNSPTITPVGSGWYRCTQLVPAPHATSVTVGPEISYVPSGGANYLGDGASGFYIWGAQLEYGTSVTAYQKVTDWSTEFSAQYPNHTLFQDSAGTTPVTAVEQPVGLMLDKRLGLVRGAELVNGSFANDTGWSWNPVAPATLTIAGGVLQFTACPSGYQAVYAGVLTVGRTYEVSYTVASISAGGVGCVTSAVQRNATGTYTEKLVADSVDFKLRSFGTTTATVDNLSVRELPGNHASQTTTAQKPVLSARKNMLVYTEQFANAAWFRSNLTNVIDGQADPFGGYTAAKLVANSVAGRHAVYMTTAIPLTVDSIATVYAKAAGVGGIEVGMGNATYQGIYVDLTTGAITDASAAYTATSTSVGDGWWKITISGSRTADTSNLWLGCSSSNNAFFSGNDVDGILICRPQWEYGLTSTTYQRVTTNTDYDTVGFPHYLKFDGVDDNLVTAAIDFTATDAVTVLAAVQKFGRATTGDIVGLTSDPGVTNGSFLLTAPAFSNSDSVGWGSRGTAFASNNENSAPYGIGYKGTLTGTADISSDTAALRSNGVQLFNATVDQGTGNYANAPLYIGRRGGTSAALSAALHQLVVRGAATVDLTPGETFFATKL